MKNIINRASIESDLNKHHVKYEDPLWDEEVSEEKENKKNLRISLRYVDCKDTEKAFEWDVFENKTLSLTLCGKDLTKKEVKFLLSKEGMQYFLELYKLGFKTQAKIKAKLKKIC